MRLLQKIIPAGSITLALTTLLSYIMGLFRDRVFAQTFGASRLLDTYNAAFILPDFIFNVAVASGIAAAFVPLFSDISREDKVKANRYTNTVITASVIVMAIAAVIIFVFAGPASRLVAPGFAGDDLKKVAELLRILALSPIIFAISNALGAASIAKRRFLFYGLSPVMYNVGIISGTLLLVPQLGIKGVAIGTIIGALLHLGTRMLDLKKLGLRIRPEFAFRTSEFKKTLRLMLPKMVGHPVELATFWGFTALASGLVPGSIVVLNFARNFQSVPVSIIGIAVATAVFPALAEAATDGSKKRFLEAFRPSLWLILFTSLLAALVISAIRNPLVDIILGGKAFSPEAVSKTAAVLGVFAFSIPAEALSQLFARAFYATKNTLIPVIFSITALIISVGGAWLLMPGFDIFALPLAFTFGSLVKLAGLAVMLPKRLARLG